MRVTGASTSIRWARVLVAGLFAVGLAAVAAQPAAVIAPAGASGHGPRIEEPPTLASGHGPRIEDPPPVVEGP